MALHLVIFSFDFVYIRLLYLRVLLACMEKVCFSLKDRKFDIVKLISIVFTSQSLGFKNNINKLIENVNKNSDSIFLLKRKNKD